MVVLPYSVFYYIYISGTLGHCFNYLCSVYWWSVYVFANDRIHYGLQVVFVCLQITPSHYHHYADSSEGIELIKCLPRLRLFSQLSFIQYMGLCVFSLPIRMSWLWECVLYLIIIIKSEVWFINHCLGLGHETMVCAVCLTMFLSLYFYRGNDSCLSVSSQNHTFLNLHGK